MPWLRLLWAPTATLVCSLLASRPPWCSQWIRGTWFAASSSQRRLWTPHWGGALQSITSTVLNVCCGDHDHLLTRSWLHMSCSRQRREPVDLRWCTTPDTLLKTVGSYTSCTTNCTKRQGFYFVFQHKLSLFECLQQPNVLEIQYTLRNPDESSSC